MNNCAGYVQQSQGLTVHIVGVVVVCYDSSAGSYLGSCSHNRYIRATFQQMEGQGLEVGVCSQSL